MSESGGWGSNAFVREHGGSVPYVVRCVASNMDQRQGRQLRDLLVARAPGDVYVAYGDPVQWVISKNLHRRHLSAVQRASCVSACIDWAEHGQQKNLERDKDTGQFTIGAKLAPMDEADSPSLTQDDSGQAEPGPFFTQSERATMADVSVRTVKKSDSYEKAGLGPEVRSGAISGAEAERRVRDPDAPRPPSRVQQLEMQVEAQALVIADVLRTGGTACTLGGTVKAPSTLGTFLRSFRWGHVRQLDRVSRELLARARAGPGDSPLTIDLDSTICETYGLAKEGARHHGYTGKRGYHPLLAVAAGTGDVLMSRLREGPGQHRPRRCPLPA